MATKVSSEEHPTAVFEIFRCVNYSHCFSFSPTPQSISSVALGFAHSAFLLGPNNLSGCSECLKTHLLLMAPTTSYPEKVSPD